MSKSKKSKAKETKQKMKKMSKPPVAPQQQPQRNVKLMSSVELGLLLGQELTRIIQAQGIIQEARTNVNNLNAELNLRHEVKLKEKDGKNAGEKR